MVKLASVSLGTDPPSKPQPSYFFYPPDIDKLTKSHPPKQTKSPQNSNMLHMFNNNIYTDIKTAYKHDLIPSYFSDLTELKYHKTKH